MGLTSYRCLCRFGIPSTAASEDLIGTDPPLARKKVIHVDLGVLGVSTVPEEVSFTCTLHSRQRRARPDTFLTQTPKPGADFSAGSRDATRALIVLLQPGRGTLLNLTFSTFSRMP